MSRFQKQIVKLPNHIRRNYSTICDRLDSGASMRSLGVKKIERFKDGVDCLSIRLSRSHRMVLLMTESGPVPEWIGTHQEYDKWLSR